MTNEKLKTLAEDAKRFDGGDWYLFQHLIRDWKMDPQDAAYIAAASPDVVLALLQENEAQAAEIAAMVAENDKLSDLWSQMRTECNALRNADVDREKYCKRLEADVAKFEPYVKEDETPFQRLEREIKDGRALMNVYGHALAEKAELESQMQGLSNEIDEFQNTVERLSLQVKMQSKPMCDELELLAERDNLRTQCDAQAARIKEIEITNQKLASQELVDDYQAVTEERDNLRARLAALHSGVELPEPAKYIIGGSEKIASGATTEYAVLVNDPSHGNYDKECTPIYTADQLHQAITADRAKRAVKLGYTPIKKHTRQLR